MIVGHKKDKLKSCVKTLVLTGRIFQYKDVFTETEASTAKVLDARCKDGTVDSACEVTICKVFNNGVVIERHGYPVLVLHDENVGVQSHAF